MQAFLMFYYDPCGIALLLLLTVYGAGGIHNNNNNVVVVTAFTSPKNRLGSACTSSSNAFDSTRHVRPTRRYLSSSPDSSSSSPFSDPSSLSASETTTASSVGDYVQGVHGGKYQFEEAGSAVMSFAGRQFAESLYSSDPNNDERVIVYEAGCNNNNQEEIPRWAQTMGTSAAKLGILKPWENYPILTFSSFEDTTEPQIAIVTISNEERSWERYYCKLVKVSPVDGTILDEWTMFCHEQRPHQPKDQVKQGTLWIHVTPGSGQLAPRGGSSNLCDPNKPYSDSATIQIMLQMCPTNSEDSLVADHDDHGHEKNYNLLVIGTEAEKWYYWLQVV